MLLQTRTAYRALRGKTQDCLLAAFKRKRLSTKQFRAYSTDKRPRVLPRSAFILRSSSLIAGGSVLAAFLGFLAIAPPDGDIPVKEVMLHNKPDDCWIVLNDEVYDVTGFLELHPGGAGRLLEVAGRDATAKFKQVHSQETLERMKDELIHVGKLKGKFANVITAEELRIEEQKAKIPSLETIFNISDFESIAKEVLPKSTFMYFASGSGDEFSLRENHYAFSRIFFRPRILQDIEPDSIDTSTCFMGTKVDMPIYISGFAGSRLAHPLGEKNLQAAAYEANVMEMVPKQNSFSSEEFYKDVPEDQNQWMQYHFHDREELENVEQVLREAEARPSIKGIFFNVDLADIGNREKDSRQRIKDMGDTSDLDFIIDNKYGQYTKFTWKDLEEIVSNTNMPVALKGVQRGEDVVLAAKKGIKAVVLSNHGGRQLDFSRPPLEVLAETRQMLKDEDLEDKIEIYLDGGIRRGSDVVKALCLGAKGVGLGRPFLYAMAGYGQDGVSHLIDILNEEIKNNMRLLGVAKIEDLNESFIDQKNLKLRLPKANDVLYDTAYEPLTFPDFR